MIEGWLGQHYVSFDGRVFEVWGPTKPTGRLHVATIRAVTLEPGRRDEVRLDVQTVWGPGNLALSLPAAQRPAAEQLAAAIRQAVGTR